jgi:hypothetical protein
VRLAGLESPSRAQLAQSRLWQRCRKALERDLAAVRLNEQQRRRVTSELFTTVLDLLRPDQWQARFLVGGDRMEKVRGRDVDLVVPSLAQAFDVILAPWFKGNARLRYENLRAWREDLTLSEADTSPTAILPRRQGDARAAVVRQLRGR